MSNLKLDRKQLAALFNNNHQAIVAFERVLGDIGTTLPTTVEEAAAQAAQGIALAGQALTMLAGVLASVEALETAPAVEGHAFPDDTAPRVELGALAFQSGESLEVGTLTAAGQIISLVAPGTAPLVVASGTRVANLNAAKSGLADALAAPSTFPGAATDLDSVITLANALRAAAITKGL